METHSQPDTVAVLGGRVIRRRLPLIAGRPAPDAPALKRLRLAQGELAQVLDGEEAIRYAAWIELQPGGVRGNHVHRRKREQFYLIAGKVRLLLEDIETREQAALVLEAGDLVNLPPGIAHALHPLEAGHGLEFAPDPLDVADSSPHRLVESVEAAAAAVAEPAWEPGRVQAGGPETTSPAVGGRSSKPGYGLERYPDAAAVLRDLEALVAQPIRPLRREAMAAVLRHFEERCAGSKAVIERARQFIPGGVQHNLAFNYPFPIVFDAAEGATLRDRDGNSYLDFLQAGGPTVLGSNPPAVRREVLALLESCSPATGLFHEYELKLAEFICGHMPSVEMFRMLGSGTEAVMAALRVARLATGRKKVIKVGGAYHGWSDQMVYSLRIPGTRGFEAHGIPRSCRAHTQETPPNDLHALERTLRWNRLRGGTAAVILEPVGPESGTRPVDAGYNQGVRDLCDRHGALLIFDEVVTAFRIGLGGAQGYFGVRPDLTVFGKVVAGGYPGAGGLGGRRDLMSCLAAGLQGGQKRALVGGTLAAAPLSAAAGYHTLLEIERTDACVRAGRAGDRLTAGLQGLIAKYGLPYVAYNQGSICHLETSGTLFVKVNLARPWTVPAALKEIRTRKHMMEEMGAAYLAEGMVTLAGSRLYTSLADTDVVIDDALARFERVFRQVEGVAAGA